MITEDQQKQLSFNWLQSNVDDTVKTPTLKHKMNRHREY